jgi:hypothetical protein
MTMTKNHAVGAAMGESRDAVGELRDVCVVYYTLWFVDLAFHAVVVDPVARGWFCLFVGLFYCGEHSCARTKSSIGSAVGLFDLVTVGHGVHSGSDFHCSWRLVHTLEESLRGQQLEH